MRLDWLHDLNRSSTLGARTARARVEASGAPQRNPEAMNPDPLPGYVWLATPGKMLHVDERNLEFRGRAG